MNSRPSLTRALAIDTTTVPASSGASGLTVATALSHGVATTTRSQEAVISFEAPRDGQGVIGPRRHQAAGDAVGPLVVPGPDDHLLAGGRQSDRQSPPGRSGSSENSDSHGPTLAQTPNPAESLVDDNLTR